MGMALGGGNWLNRVCAACFPGLGFKQYAFMYGYPWRPRITLEQEEGARLGTQACGGSQARPLRGAVVGIWGLLPSLPVAAHACTLPT